MLSSNVSPSPNITDSPTNRTAGRAGSTASSIRRTRYAWASKAYSTVRPAMVVRAAREGTTGQPRLVGGHCGGDERDAECGDHDLTRRARCSTLVVTTRRHHDDGLQMYSFCVLRVFVTSWLHFRGNDEVAGIHAGDDVSYEGYA